MGAHHYGRSYSMETLRRKAGINREGVSLLGIGEAAENNGFRTVGAKLTSEQLQEEPQMPCIIYRRQVHVVVVCRIADLMTMAPGLTESFSSVMRKEHGSHVIK